MPIRRKGIIVNPEVPQQVQEIQPAGFARVPYRERRIVRKGLVPRLEKLRRRRLKLRLYVVTALSFLVLATIVSQAARVSERAAGTKAGSQQTRTSGAPGTSAPARSVMFLVCGASPKNTLTGASLIAYDASMKRALVFSMPPSASVGLLGAGYRTLGSLAVRDLETVAYSFINEFSYPVSFSVVVRDADYRAALSKKDLSRLVRDPLVGPLVLPDASRSGSSQETSLGAVGKVLSRLDSGAVETIEMPTRVGKAGAEEVTLLDTRKLEQFVQVLLGTTFSRETTARTVLVVNGTAEPDSGVRAAFAVIKAGYRVFDVRTAERKTQQTTVIEVYGLPASEGDPIAKALGCGRVVEKPISNGLVDASILVGADFAARK
jgi:hypothetical protein